jgi:hypothetical protein
MTDVDLLAHFALVRFWDDHTDDTWGRILNYRGSHEEEEA